MMCNYTLHRKVHSKWGERLYQTPTPIPTSKALYTFARLDST